MPRAAAKASTRETSSVLPGRTTASARPCAVAPALLVAGQLVRLGHDRVRAQQGGQLADDLGEVERSGHSLRIARRVPRGDTRGGDRIAWKRGPTDPRPGARRTPQPDSGRGPQAGGHPPAQGGAGRRSLRPPLPAHRRRARRPRRERGGAAAMARPGPGDARDHRAAPVRGAQPRHLQAGELGPRPGPPGRARAGATPGSPAARRRQPLRPGVPARRPRRPHPLSARRRRPAPVRARPRDHGVERHLRLRARRRTGSSAWPPWGSSSGSTTSAPATRPWSGSAACPRTASRSRAPSWSGCSRSRAAR